ncbi:hypothetical protein [Turicibacter sanguinis]|uniref:hypothetical protein n=1 Tax=Turicibacter sanguinis TaxID=154288 RepID=UPI0018A88985|nr:hypothetical protein [Turicibacter sanguinis]
MKKKLSIKSVMMSLAVALVIFSTIGSTVAWLITKTEPVKNTFTYGDINITLTETDTGDNDGNSNTNSYIMIPGKTIVKDPKVTVQKGSENSWLFVKVENSTEPAFDNFMTYEIAEGWTALEGIENVYYREVDKPIDADAEFSVIKDNIVTVKETVTKEDLNALTNYPTLTITAYAVQRDHEIDAIDTAVEAWTLVSQSSQTK